MRDYRNNASSEQKQKDLQKIEDTCHSDIIDREVYNARMARTVVDKIFFLAHIDADVFVDYGCANGEVLRAINNFVPESTCIGYDISLEMLKEAKTLSPDNFIFTNSLEEIKRLVDELQGKGKKVCLILSSVIHEIYSYSSPQDIHYFWSFINNIVPFNYIAIRDMTYSAMDNKFSTIELAHLNKIASQFRTKEVNDFTRRWGRLHEGNNALHFLLKYRYKENWDREVEENYLPVPYEMYFNKLPEYEPIFQHRYTLPYIKKCVHHDFGLEMKFPTHCQLIFERK